MSQKRMFDRAIIDMDKFMDLPMSAKAIYFLLGMEADDEGFVSYKKILRIHGGNEDDIKVLLAKSFIISFPSGVVVVTDWNKNNWLDKRRIRPTEYQTEKKLLVLNEDNSYCLASAKPMLSQYSIEESSIEEKRINTSSKEEDKFNSFWLIYPARRTNKEKCRIKFNKLDENTQNNILLDIKNRIEKDEKWIKGYIPETMTYLNNHKWEDDIQEIKTNNGENIIEEVMGLFEENGISIPDKIKKDKIEQNASIELYNSKGIEKVRNILEYCMENKVFYNFTTPNKLLTNYEAIRLSKINKDKK